MNTRYTISLLLLASACCGCGGGTAARPSGADIRGRVVGCITAPVAMRTRRLAGFVKVEGPVSSDARFNVVAITVTDTTLLLRKDSALDRPAGFSGIHVGDSVEVWFNGALDGSYPPQATATRIRIITPR